MGKQAKIEPIGSRTFEVVIKLRGGMLAHVGIGGIHEGIIDSWFVRNRETLADTEKSSNFDDYRKLKRVWRSSKEDFESACRFMEFHNLFSSAGVSL